MVRNSCDIPLEEKMISDVITVVGEPRGERYDIIYKKDCRIGYVQMKTFFYNDNIAFIDYFIINREYRNRGIGTLVFKFLMKLWKENGIESICLFVVEESIDFWNSIGFDVNEDNWTEDENYCINI